MIAYNIGNKFDGGGRNYKTFRLATSDDLLGRPKELVGRLAIREATAEVVSRSAVVFRQPPCPAGYVDVNFSRNSICRNSVRRNSVCTRGIRSAVSFSHSLSLYSIT